MYSSPDKEMYSMNPAEEMYSLDQGMYSVNSTKARTRRSLIQNVFSYTSHLVGRSIQVL